jgi:dienelactone hydrolase
MAFRPAAGAETPYTAPPYVTPAAFTETSVTIGAGEWALPGTLTLPVGTTRVPVVILVHGSGPADRDATMGPNKPFRDLAGGLASRGIAVLRYDKRTYVHRARVAALPRLTVREETIDDVLQASQMLRAHPRVDASKIYVAGHSLGGMLIPRIAAADASLAGVIVMAGAARPLEEAILAQSRYMAEADGTVTAAEQQSIDQANALITQVRALTPADAASGTQIFGAPAAYWLDLRGYDPPAAATQIKVPMLILQGERDYQVTMAEFARWKAALNGRTDVTFHSYPALNHLFIAGTGPSLPGEYQVPGHVAEDVVRDIASWITRAGGV